MSNVPAFIVDQDELNESLLMHDISRLIRKYFDRRAKALGLTRAQWLALSVLWRSPGIKQAELADKLDVEPMTVARLIDRMEDAGWVERRADKGDRRLKRLYLTQQAENIIKRLRALSIETRTMALEGFDEDQHKQLLGLLHKIRHTLNMQKTD